MAVEGEVSRPPELDVAGFVSAFMLSLTSIENGVHFLDTARFSRKFISKR